MIDKKTAFTFTEVLIALVLVGFLVVLTITNGKKQSANIDKTKLKKAYNLIETNVYNLINDTNIYPSEIGFRDIRAVKTEFGEYFGSPDTNTKFRDAFKYTVEVVEDGIDCEIWKDNTSNNACFKTSEGIVWGIPATNFDDLGTQEINIQRTGDTVIYKFVPITIYTNYDKKKDLDNDAFFIGVNFIGQLQIMTKADCAITPTITQCLAREYLYSTTLKK